MSLEMALRRYGITEYESVDTLPDTANQGDVYVVHNGVNPTCHIWNNGKFEQIKFIQPLEDALCVCPICGGRFDENGFCLNCD